MRVTGFGPAQLKTSLRDFRKRVPIMWVTGFGPAQALSHRILSPAYLTTLAHPRDK